MSAATCAAARYNKIDPADNFSADARIGLQYATGNHLWQGGLTHGRYVLDNTSTRFDGANLDWRYLLDGQNQITIGAWPRRCVICRRSRPAKISIST